MKKSVLLLTSAFLSVGLWAQERGLKESGLKDNWFFQLQGGASYMFAEGQDQSSLGDILAPHVAISVGKYFSPAMGARLQLGGWQAKTYLGKTINKSFKNEYVQVSADAILSLVNAFKPYDPKRAFDLSIIGGVAYVGSKKNAAYGVPRSNQIIPRIGGQIDYKLNRNLSLNLEAVCNFNRDDWNGRYYGHEYDENVTALLGLTYRFGDGFKVVEADLSEIKSLNDKLNAQKSQLNEKDSELDRLRNELANIKPGKTEVITKDIVKTEVLMNAIVVFRLNSAKLEDNQEINIYNAARYLKENPGVKVTITGYADKQTGNATINQKLSEQRAAAVKKDLIEKYGISENRIISRAYGDKEQLFPTAEWNRVVVFSAKGE